MNDNFIHVQITKANASVDKQSEKSFSPKSATRSPNDGKKADIKSDAINVGLIQMGKSALSYATSNYGNITGDTIGQQQLNEMISVAGMIATASTGTLGLIAAGTQLAISGVNRFVDIQQSRVASRNMQARYGISLGGSR